MRVGAQGAQWLFSETSHIEVQCKGLRGRRPARADHRLRTDDDPVRTQSAIVGETQPEPLLLVSMRVQRVCAARC